MKEQERELDSTGRVRVMLANSLKGVLNGDMAVDKALAVHKLAKNITDSLYSEAKIAILHKELGITIDKFGQLNLGDPRDTAKQK